MVMDQPCWVLCWASFANAPGNCGTNPMTPRPPCSFDNCACKHEQGYRLDSEEMLLNLTDLQNDTVPSSDSTAHLVGACSRTIGQRWIAELISCTILHKALAFSTTPDRCTSLQRWGNTGISTRSEWHLATSTWKRLDTDTSGAATSPHLTTKIDPLWSEGRSPWVCEKPSNRNQREKAKSIL